MVRTHQPQGQNLIEFTEIMTPDGELYKFEDYSSRFMFSITGMGYPPVEYKTQRGPFQHGDTEVDYSLRPRTITLIHRRQGCSRQDYWDARRDLLNMLRPNRQTTFGGLVPHQLRKIKPDGTIWAIDVRLQTGPVFMARNTASWDEWAYAESLQFIAQDPLFYNPTEVENTVTLLTLTELVFPITFDVAIPAIVFGSSTINELFNINYAGDWLSYPTIEIDGPLTNPIITNETTGEKIGLTYAVSIGETVTINTEYGNKTIENGAGTNLIGTLTTDSDLATFAVHPDPLAPDGVNSMRIQGTNADAANTEIRVDYFTRYTGT